MSDINIINGKVLISGLGVVETGLSLSDGRIVAIAGNGHLPSASETIDASGLVVFPGIIDPHVHLGLFQGFEADCKSETRSALMGGVTTIGCYLGGTASHSKTLPEIEAVINAHSYADIFPHLCINTEEQQQEIPDYVKRFGVTSFKFFMFCIPGYMPSQTNDFILKGFRNVADCGHRCFCSVHAEDSSMMLDGWKRFFEQGGTSLGEWADCNPTEAEVLGVTVASTLADLCGCRINIVHLATAGGLDKLRTIRAHNPSVTVETLALYLSVHSSSDIDPIAGRWSPAVRSEQDQEALWDGIRDGTVATVGTDQDCVDKAGLEKFIRDYGVPGSSALDALLLPLLLTGGYHERKISLERLIGTVTVNPARLWGIYPQKGIVAVGSDADLVLVDLESEFVVDHSALQSASDWSLYQGRRLRGRPVITIKDGKTVMREGEIVVDKGNGKRLRVSPAPS
ncbi:MAG: amidohydrolase family protein [Deltaproteobacteria bacterium]|nr:amidohydrolase family protein [Deltaproteobacteria bacterium]